MKLTHYGGGSRAAASSKMECFGIIVNGFEPLTITTKLPDVNYYHKALHLGCRSSPRSVFGDFTKFCCFLVPEMSFSSHHMANS